MSKATQLGQAGLEEQLGTCHWPGLGLGAMVSGESIYKGTQRRCPPVPIEHVCPIRWDR